MTLSRQEKILCGVLAGILVFWFAVPRPSSSERFLSHARSSTSEHSLEVDEVRSDSNGLSSEKTLEQSGPREIQDQRALALLRQLSDAHQNPGSLLDPSLAPTVAEFDQSLPPRTIEPKEEVYLDTSPRMMPTKIFDNPFWQARTQGEAVWMDAQGFPRDFNVLSWDRFAVEKAAKAGNRTAMNMLMHIRLEQGDPKWDREFGLVRNPSAYNARLRAVVALGFIGPGDFALRQRGGWREPKPVNVVEAIAWDQIAQRFGDYSNTWFTSLYAYDQPAISLSMKDLSTVHNFVRQTMGPKFNRFVQFYARERAAGPDGQK